MSIKPASIKTIFSISSSQSPYPLSTISISNFSSSPNHSTQSSHSYSRRHDDESRNVKVSVWWDFENCHPPAGANAYRVTHTITDAIRSCGIKGPITITAFGDVMQLSRGNQEALSSTGINISHVPTGGKNSADRSLLVDLMYWVSQNPPPAHLFLISGDRDFSGVLHRLRMKNYNILLAGPASTPSVLCSAASVMWQWKALIEGDNLTGKHFNKPPDGSYGSWYGHSKAALEDPFAVVEQPTSLQTKELSKPTLDSNVGPVSPIPKVIVKQIRRILSLHPKGISMFELRSELNSSNVIIDKDLYGYKKFSRFLLSMPQILKLQPKGDGQVVVCGITPKGPVPFESTATNSTELAYNEGHGSSLSSKLISESGYVNEAVESKPRSCPSSPEPRVEESSRNEQQISPTNDELIKPVKKKPPETIANASDVSKGQHVMVEENPPNEKGAFKTVWARWFGGDGGRSELNIVPNQVPEESSAVSASSKCRTSSNEQVNEKVKGKSGKSNGPNADPVMSVSSSSNFKGTVEGMKKSTDAASDTATSPGFLTQFLNWCRSWGSKSDNEDKSDQPTGNVDIISSNSQKNEKFLKNSFWSDMESFMDSPRASVAVSQSMTRAQLAENLQKEGPLVLKFLTSGDVLHLVDLLISEKKWINESASKMSPFKTTRPIKTASTSNPTLAANGLRSIFLAKQSESKLVGEKRVPIISNEKPSDKSRSEVLTDCQNLVNHILKQYPEGFNMGSFRKLFLERYGYSLEIEKLGYRKLVSLLQIMPGVRIESTYIVPNEAGLGNPSRDDIKEHAVGDSSSWEELGPVSDTKTELQSAPCSRIIEDAKRRKCVEYEPPCFSDEEFSDSDAETLSSSNTTESRKKKTAVDEEESPLLDILESWHSSKTGDDNKKLDNVDVPKRSSLSEPDIESGKCFRNDGRKQRVVRNYSFVSDSVDHNKDKLIDGILGTLQKSSNSKMQS